MSDSRASKSTVYVGNIADDVDEQALLQVFSTFGDVMEVQIPTVDRPHYQGSGQNQGGPPGARKELPAASGGKHRGFAFITFGNPADAKDCIDNMDLNELNGKVIKVNLAKPMKGPVAGQGNRAIWETEEWLKSFGTNPSDPAGENGKPAEGGETEAGADDMEE